MLDAERVGDAIDVVEVADHLCRVVNGTVVEAVVAECVNIGRNHLLRRFCQLLRKATQCLIRWVQVSQSPISCQLMNEQIGCAFVFNAPIVFDLSTKVIAV